MQIGLILKRALRKAGALDVINHFTASGRAEIMLYHGFCEGRQRDSRFHKLMPIEQFEQQIRIFLRYSKPLRLEDLAREEAQGVVLTFDDGYANNYHLAFPVLEKYQFPATIFIATGFVDRTVPLWGDRLHYAITAGRVRNSVFEWKGERFTLAQSSPVDIDRLFATLRQRLMREPLSGIHDFLCHLERHLQVSYEWSSIPEALKPLHWDHARSMLRSGLVSFGAHTVSHPVLSRCSEELQRLESLTSKRRLEEELGRKCTLFAYPYGKYTDYTGVTAQIVKEAGFELAVTTEYGANKVPSRGEYELKRWGADISADEISFLVSGGLAVSGHMRNWLRPRSSQNWAPRKAREDVTAGPPN
jgi:peptidoglycan/xylan/chitin deacetylase (PgdA/CDA1 family)